ncbi:hypothetical protein QG025_08165 [Kingella kingae]|uniref:hypothetical protein n=1 Tax=Kingella kingae TaxID=504 RepID=UPI0025530D56|nr:hypothetical protein [Kingella kingae]MDK4581137.1 hypothetical protein [Kingella kingae]
MNNAEFIQCLTQSFVVFLNTHSRSNAKLKVLHGAIAQDLSARLGESYRIQSLGHGNDKEGQIAGRYINKNVDIVVYKNQQAIAGIGVKFVMQNYAQNANNYFENMLGETANIQSQRIPYFQIMVIPKTLPYYKKSGQFDKWEQFNAHHIQKYVVLSQDNQAWAHTPTKTLLCVLDMSSIEQPVTKGDYVQQYLQLHQNQQLIMQPSPSNLSFGNNLIYNNYVDFMNEITHHILCI